MNHGSFPLKNRSVMPATSADDFIDLDMLLAAARRQLRLVGLFALLGLMLGALYLVFTPSLYTASTRILLDDSLTKFAEDKQTPPAGPQADAMVLSEVEILKSSRLARSVVMDQKLQDNDAFLNPPRSPLAWFKATVKSVAGLSSPVSSNENARIGKAVGLLQSRLRAERVGRSLVIELSFEDHDPRLAGAITRAYADAYLSDHLNANFDATQRATVWLQGRLDDLRSSSQEAALAVEQFRARTGLTAARGELMSEQQLSDLNSQVILAQADTANAFARYNQFKAIVDNGPDNAVKNATIPAEKGTSGNNTNAINEMKSRYLSISKREQDISSRFGEDHAQAVALRREEADLTRQIFAELQRLTESYRNEYQVAKSREDSLRTNVRELSGKNSMTGKDQVELRNLEQKSQALATLYQAFLARYEEAAQQRSFPIAQARVISQADDPTTASSPRKSMVLGLSLVLGLFAGVAGGAVQEFRERFFRTGDDVRDSLDLNFLGYLPRVGNRLVETAGKAATNGEKARQPGPETVTPRMLRVAINAPSSSFAETLRNVKLAADVVLHHSPCKVIGFVSVLPREGKTTVAANFAGLLAANGARTLLIDADLRNPGLSRSLPLPEKGLVEAIVGDVRWQNVCLTDRKTRLTILPTVGRRRLSHTSELISGPAMASLIEEMRASFDYIVVDLPPLGPVVDAKAFAPLADGFVMVAEWGATPRVLVRSILQTERQIAARTLGIVLNKTDMKKLARYGQLGGAEQYLDRYGSYYVEEVSPGAKTGRMEKA
ncbi:succinoglycan biosynthesis transport protein ExoP [Pseudaminobacter salicylatoxidans]|uniref:non-specific protein-tyrosine kinase n=1 Tax=Pseudaminobacter salicylatoxidans TaxID=93369 RepID=A0A316C1E1_PSESE|nr:succinoglycan biosynthesis transport protein ExoP [Pseudaminobacter salicylatoxidans]